MFNSEAILFNSFTFSGPNKANSALVKTLPVCSFINAPAFVTAIPATVEAIYVDVPVSTNAVVNNVPASA